MLLVLSGALSPRSAARRISRAVSASAASERSSGLSGWPAAFDNSLLRELRGEPPGAPPLQSRQVHGAHYTRVRPTVTAPQPILVIWSSAVAECLGLLPDDCESKEFLAVFSGSPPASYECWATAYGASFTGQYGGQRGDGRAISIGQYAGYEIQLKGAGVTPYSRQFDGRAVLRSSIREFLASEAMAALRVPTTRSLCVVTTGEEVVRQWYDERGAQRIQAEPGAVGTRVATSFLRFGQMELFYQRRELDLLRELAEHALKREFPHLQDAMLSRNLVRMFDEICRRQATLIAEWLRVGYCQACELLADALFKAQPPCGMRVQGNMNSDNSALSGVTLDYGPFAFMEKFQPHYNPWVGGGVPYSFARQPQAAAANLAGLSSAFVELLDVVGKEEGQSTAEINSNINDVRNSVSSTFVDCFHAAHDCNCRAKLGLVEWDSEAEELWNDLLRLMSTQSGANGVDFTNLFRALSVPLSSLADSISITLKPAAFQEIDHWPQEHKEEWEAWMKRYRSKLEFEERPGAERLAEMESTNPRYILRNWMAVEAYEAAASGNYDVVREIHNLLSNPYNDQGSEADERWGGLTPQWARDRPGVAFMS